MFGDRSNTYSLGEDPLLEYHDALVVLGILPLNPTIVGDD